MEVELDHSLILEITGPFSGCTLVFYEKTFFFQLPLLNMDASHHKFLIFDFLVLQELKVKSVTMGVSFPVARVALLNAFFYVSGFNLPVFTWLPKNRC